VPDFSAIFASMGIDVRDGEIHLQEQGPGARLRREIVRGGAGEPRIGTAMGSAL